MSLAGLAAIALVALGLAAPLLLAGSAYKEFENSGCCSGTEVPTPQFALHHPVPSTLRSPWQQLAAVQYKKPTAVVRKGFPRVCSAVAETRNEIYIQLQFQPQLQLQMHACWYKPLPLMMTLSCLVV